ncbi:MAG: carboxypeptidase-like regulatory domain-containing protein [Saprospiraceae bacterium]
MKLLTLIFFSLNTFFAAAESFIHGQITDSETDEVIVAATIYAYQDHILISETKTDLNGKYKLSLSPGAYDLVAFGLPFKLYRRNYISVEEGKSREVDFDLMSGFHIQLEEVVVVDYKIPLVNYSFSQYSPIKNSPRVKPKKLTPTIKSNRERSNYNTFGNEGSFIEDDGLGTIEILDSLISKVTFVITSDDYGNYSSVYNFSNNGKKIKILNSHGKVVTEFPLIWYSYCEINTSEWPSGLYHISYAIHGYRKANRLYFKI